MKRRLTVIRSLRKQFNRWTSGSYASYEPGPETRRQVARRRLRWLKIHTVTAAQTRRLHPDDPGLGETLHREWGRWVIRPVRGWRSWTWITPPLHANRSIAAADRDAAVDWMMEVLEQA
ncbi:hypothetical protein [Saccharopolyspora phatthalungensis]|uniref:Uncharacterized protein n=1 Tax=Saccharopolyspora phatthalungensis TaxID=664693 RepID=A0A840QKU0_9PSEU|nr:hypothetical protein [Saccharopolyspora phatthalungensis]MBB5159413.1 hypothetical protein [Saccharopolyspora phatthalungensis]